MLVHSCSVVYLLALHAKLMVAQEILGIASYSILFSRTFLYSSNAACSIIQYLGFQKVQALALWNHKCSLVGHFALLSAGVLGCLIL